MQNKPENLELSEGLPCIKHYHQKKKVIILSISPEVVLEVVWQVQRV